MSDQQKVRFRKAPKAWQDVFKQATKLEHYAKIGFDGADIKTIADNSKIQISRESIRVKLARYKHSGYVKNVSKGRFIVPPPGYHFFDLIQVEDPRVIYERNN
ncbi:MAG: hypothetical protein ACPGVT_12565 [Maricaulaceae bacterium]